jgi:hypothetical protein
MSEHHQSTIRAPSERHQRRTETIGATRWCACLGFLRVGGLPIPNSCNSRNSCNSCNSRNSWHQCRPWLMCHGPLALHQPALHGTSVRVLRTSTYVVRVSTQHTQKRPYLTPQCSEWNRSTCVGKLVTRSIQITSNMLCKTAVRRSSWAVTAALQRAGARTESHKNGHNSLPSDWIRTIRLALESL